MSFCVDLWNGFDIIKNQYSSIRSKIKIFHKLINSYFTIETNYFKSLDSIMKEFKEIEKEEYPIDSSFNKIFGIFKNELYRRKIYDNNLFGIILAPINAFLENPKTRFNKLFSENSDNEDNFNRSLGILIEKQNIFHNHCRELATYLAQLESVENNNSQKGGKNKSQKMLEKIKDYKDDYINCIIDTNLEREKYNSKTEKILSDLEDMYQNMIGKFRDALFNFTQNRIKFFKLLLEKEEKEFNEIHSQISTEKEINLFIRRNATKEFPMLKIELCPVKLSVLVAF